MSKPDSAHQALEDKIDKNAERFMDKLELVHKDIGDLKASRVTWKDLCTMIVAMGAALLAWFK